MEGNLTNFSHETADAASRKRKVPDTETVRQHNTISVVESVVHDLSSAVVEALTKKQRHATDGSLVTGAPKSRKFAGMNPEVNATSVAQAKTLSTDNSITSIPAAKTSVVLQASIEQTTRQTTVPAVVSTTTFGTTGQQTVGSAKNPDKDGDNRNDPACDWYLYLGLKSVVGRRTVATLLKQVNLVCLVAFNASSFLI